MDGSLRASFAAAAHSSDELSSLDGPVVGLFRGDRLLAVEGAGGDRVETAYVTQGPLRSGLLALALVALALLLVATAFDVTRAPGWSLLAASAAGLVSLMLGGIPWASVALVAATLATAALVAPRSERATPSPA